MIDRKQFTKTRIQPTDHRVSKINQKKTNLIMTHFPLKEPPLNFSGGGASHIASPLKPPLSQEILKPSILY